MIDAARARLLPREIVIALALAGMNGAALLAYSFWGATLGYAVRRWDARA